MIVNQILSGDAFPLVPDAYPGRSIRGLWVGTLGDVRLEMPDGSQVLIKNAQGYVPMAPVRVLSSGTTATDIVGVGVALVREQTPDPKPEPGADQPVTDGGLTPGGDTGDGGGSTPAPTLPAPGNGLSFRESPTTPGALEVTVSAPYVVPDGYTLAIASGNVGFTPSVLYPSATQIGSPSVYTGSQAFPTGTQRAFRLYLTADGASSPELTSTQYIVTMNVGVAPAPELPTLSTGLTIVESTGTPGAVEISISAPYQIPANYTLSWVQVPVGFDPAVAQGFEHVVSSVPETWTSGSTFASGEQRAIRVYLTRTGETAAELTSQEYILDITTGNDAGSGGGGDPVDPGDTGGPGDVVDVSAIGSSVGFPMGNNFVATGPTLVLRQPVDNWFEAFRNTNPAAWWAIVRLPLAERTPIQAGESSAYNIFQGFADSNNRSFNVLWHPAMDPIDGQKVRFVLSSGRIYTPVITEEAALIVCRRNPSNLNQIHAEWYSLVDGTRSVVTETNVNYITFNNDTDGVAGIGGNGNTTAGNDALYREFPGDIAQMGYLEAPNTVADWQAIALGADPVTTFGASNIKFMRRLDGTTTGLTVPADATSDGTGATTVYLGSLDKGAAFFRQSTARYLTVDTIGSGTGYVFGVVPGQTTKQVIISGAGGGFTGPVEAKVILRDTQETILDWTDGSPLSGGAWTWTGTLPIGWEGYYEIIVRAKDDPTLIVHHGEEFGVGFKFLQLGQSQSRLYLISGTDTNEGATSDDASAVFASLKYSANDDRTRAGTVRWIGPVLSDSGVRYDRGMALWLRTFRLVAPKVPLMLLDGAVNGTGPDQLMDDANPARDTEDLRELLNRFGSDVSCVLMNWATQGWNINNGANAAETFEALMTGSWPGTAHSPVTFWLEDVLQSGFKMVLSIAMRHAQGVHDQERQPQITYAESAANVELGQPTPDIPILDGQAHQNNSQRGNQIFGVRQATGALKALGLLAWEQPYWSQARISTDRTTITLGATLPNGGSLTSPAPSALAAFEYRVDGGGALTDFDTATINGGVVTLTKASGFAAGTIEVRQHPNGAQGLGGTANETAENAASDGHVYESHPIDPMGRGLIVSGTFESGAYQAGGWLTATTGTATNTTSDNGTSALTENGGASQGGPSGSGGSGGSGGGSGGSGGSSYTPGPAAPGSGNITFSGEIL